MLHTIQTYEFLREDGEFALMTERLADHPSSDPVLLVSAIDNRAYLRRGPDDIYEVPDIDPAIVVCLRRQEYVVVVEMEGDRAAHSYDAPVGALEYDPDASAVTKALTVFSGRLARCWAVLRGQA